MRTTIVRILIDIVEILISAFVGRWVRRMVRTSGFAIRHKLLINA